MINKEFILKNFPKGKLSIIYGYPAMAKSSFAISLAKNMAKENMLSLYFSLEMDKEKFVMRLLKHMSEDEILDCCNKIWVCDTPNLHIGDMRTMIESHSVDYIFVDTLQLMDIEPGTSRDEEVIAIISELKRIAYELNIAIIALSPIGGINRKHQRSGISNIREVFHAILEGVNISFIHRPEYHQIVLQYGECKEFESIEYIVYKDGIYEIIPMKFNCNTTEVSLCTEFL